MKKLKDVKRFLDYISRCHPILISDCINGSHFYKSNKGVMKKARKYLELIKDEKLTHPITQTVIPESHYTGLAWTCAISRHLDIRDVLNDDNFGMFRCYNNKGSVIVLDSVIRSESSVFVAKGHMLESGICVVVKYYKSGSSGEDITYEMDCYKKLRAIADDMIWISTSYKIMGYPVLVMEELDVLTGLDNEYHVGRDILRQLQLVHKFGFYGSCKPENFIRNGNSYYLIDFGYFCDTPVADNSGDHKSSGDRKALSSGDRKALCYKRKGTNPKFGNLAEKQSRRGLVGYHSDDLMELAFSIRGIQLMRSGEKITWKSLRSGYTGPLLKFMEEIKKVEHQVLTERDYDRFYKILSV
jgi:hypothetical protein